MPDTSSMFPDIATAAANAADSIDTPQPDLVDRLFDLLRADPRCPRLQDRTVAALKAELRAECWGTRQRIRRLSPQSTGARDLLALFNGRNATEVARELGCSRATVYRWLKQAGRRDHPRHITPSHPSPT